MVDSSETNQGATPDERLPDPRTKAVRTNEKSPDGQTLWITFPSEIQVGDKKVGWYEVDPVAFSLLEAKKLCDRAAPKRAELIADHDLTPDKRAFRIANNEELMDVFSDLWSAIMHSFAALEAFANNVVEVLPPGTNLMYKGERLTTDEIVRRVGTEVKFKRFVPRHPDAKHIAGQQDVWSKFQRLKAMRDGIVHVKDGNSDQTGVSVNDQIVQGDADTCAADAYEIIEAAWPGFFQDHVVAALTAPPSPNGADDAK